MRHVFVTNDFPPKTGGIESYLVALVSGFPPDDVTVVAPAREGYPAVDEHLPYEVVRVPGRYLRATARVGRSVETAVKARRADAVHYLQALPLGRLGVRVRRATGVPFTVVAHGSEILLPARIPLVRSSLRRVLSSADLVLPVSEHTQDVVDRVSKGRADTAVLHPSVDIKRFSLGTSGARVRQRHRLGSRFVVLFVSRLVKRKGAEILVRALEHTPEAVALVAGTGPELATIKRVAGEAEVSKRVLFAGYVPDEELPHYYAAADVFCMPCTDRYGGIDTEGFGIVYIEAGASGLPSIAGTCGGSIEAVVDGVTGIVLPDPTPTSVAKAIRRLHADPVLRTRMGAAARQRAEDEFSPVVQALRLEQALDRAGRARR